MREDSLFVSIFSTKSRTKILEYLAEVNEMNISQIVNTTHLNHITVKKDLEYFIEIGLVQEKRFGRIAIYRFRDEDIRCQAIISIIKLLNGEDQDE
jgi:DeoR/GlpR family transcriptional regulator of sugar metabolism